MTQLKNLPNNHTQVSIFFANKKITIKAEFIQFSPVLTAAYACNAEKIVLDDLLADIQSLSFDEFSTLFIILETIYTTLTPRRDGGYITQQVQTLVNEAFTDKSNIFLSNVCLVAYTLDIHFLVNACIGTIFANTDAIFEIREIDKFDSYLTAGELVWYEPANGTTIAQVLSTMRFALFSQAPILKLLEKHYYFSHNNLQELSIVDYIAMHGEPLIENGILNMSEKNLTSLHGIDQLSNKESITCLYLAHNFLGNSIKTENTVSLASFTNLAALDLSHNRITNLPPYLFKGLTSVTILYVGYNQLTTLEPMIFQELTHLKTLWLKSNYLKDLPAQIFKNLINLKVLYLNNNTLTYLDPLLFQGLHELETLELSDNRLTQLPDNIFQGLNTNLQNLSLRNNSIAYLDIAPLYEIAKNKNLKNIVFDDHNLQQLHAQQRKILLFQEKIKDQPAVES